MFDTHAHLNFEVFKDSFSDIIKKSREDGILNIVVPGTDFDTSKKAIDIATDYEGIYAAVGIHPTKELDLKNLEAEVYKIEELANYEKVVAIGEIGLDYYRFKSPASIQKKYFEAQIKLAKKLDKSLIIHNRHAGHEVVKTVEKSWDGSLSRRCVFHCCEADHEMLSFALEKGIFLGVDGDITFDNDKLKFISKVPIEQLVVETDSPYILPEPKRSEKAFPNTSSNLIYIIETVSKIKKLPIDEVKLITSLNAKTLFGLN